MRLQPILPARFSRAGFDEGIQNALRETGIALTRSFKATTSTWNHQPSFVTTRDLRSANRPSLLVSTSDDIYRWLNDGTRRHPIARRRAPYLAYLNVYRAKTVPGVLQARSGGKAGMWVRRLKVSHPGNEARHFDATVARLEQPRLERRVEVALEYGRTRSGHAI